MKIGMYFKGTKESWEMLETFFRKVNFFPHYKLEIFLIKEIKEQGDTLEKIKKELEKKLKENKAEGEVIKDTGEPVSRVIKLLEKRKIELFVASYQHSFLQGSFCEQIIRQTDLPILIIR